MLAFEAATAAKRAASGLLAAAVLLAVAWLLAALGWRLLGWRLLGSRLLSAFGVLLALRFAADWLLLPAALGAACGAS